MSVRAGGVGSGKSILCRVCGRPVEQPWQFPRVVKWWCGPRCEAKETEGEKQPDWGALIAAAKANDSK